MLYRLAALTVSLVPAMAHAGSLYLNGVNIDGVTNQTFANCTVTIDAQGNVFIAATGYAVAGPDGRPVVQPPAAAPQAAPGVAPQAAPAVGAPALSRQYWLVTEKAAPGTTHYDLDLYVNARHVRRLSDAEEHLVMDITGYLTPGKNRITIVAHKTGAGPADPSRFVRVVIGEGAAQGRDVMISRKLVDYRRTAAETKDFRDEFFVTAS